MAASCGNSSMNIVSMAKQDVISIACPFATFIEVMRTFLLKKMFWREFEKKRRSKGTIFAQSSYKNIMRSIK